MINTVKRAEAPQRTKGVKAPQGIKGLTALFCASLLGVATGCMETIQRNRQSEGCPEGYLKQIFKTGPEVINNQKGKIFILEEPFVGIKFNPFSGPHPKTFGSNICVPLGVVVNTSEGECAVRPEGDERFFYDPNCDGEGASRPARLIEGEVFAPKGFVAKLVRIEEVLENGEIIPLELPNRGAFLYPETPVAVFNNDENPFNGGIFEEYTSPNGKEGYIQTAWSNSN